MFLVIATIIGFMQYNTNNQFKEYQKQGNALEQLNNNLTTIMSRQEKTDDLRKNIYTAYASADKEYTKMKAVLGDVLAKHEVAFPQNLNMAMAEFLNAFKNINSELILLPE